jgi:hypothetical protein
MDPSINTHVVRELLHIRIDEAAQYRSRPEPVRRPRPRRTTTLAFLPRLSRRAG